MLPSKSHVGIFTPIMTAHPLLIASETLKTADLIAPPFGLQPEEFVLTRLESLAVLGFSRFSAVVVHEPPADLFRRLSLGLRDSPDAEALWTLISQARSVPVFVLSASIERPPRELSDLGIGMTIPQRLHELCTTHADPGAGNTGPMVSAASLLTADDVRALHLKGVKTLDESTPMTDWARETAAALGIRLTPAASRRILIPVEARSVRHLASFGELLHGFASSPLAPLFVVAEPLMPAFNDLFPSLRGRLVAPSIHWEKQGAFTGEISLAMALDLGCEGAIVPDLPAYAEPKRFAQLCAAVAGKQFSLYVPSPLAARDCCAIIGDRIFRLTDGRGRPAPELPKDGALVMKGCELEKIAQERN
ncbi:MAG TPA: triose-phosphate isomerase [Candidatus Ozemobacteraceae bacterium]|nr:triose-phosphate isomerase [Candidatus Ozemobacteraceae bacterium]